MKKRILITGGAGFIGSNLAESLLDDPYVGLVRVLDNLATGSLKNIEKFQQHPNFEFVNGDIRDYDTCLSATKGIDVVSHQAALGSVPRSVKDPITTNNVNVTGFLNMITASKEQKIKRFVFAASSSTYGDNEALPKVEENIGSPLSPYAVTKYVNELYAKVFSDVYDFNFIGFRYFNVFGPKQDPHGAYAAVIPLFINAALNNKPPNINGNGEHSRDFTYVGNVVEANRLGIFTNNDKALNEVYNIAYGERTSLNELWALICENIGVDILPNYGPNRIGDVMHSHADISKARELLKYDPKFSIVKGLKVTCQWDQNR